MAVSLNGADIITEMGDHHLIAVDGGEVKRIKAADLPGGGGGGGFLGNSAVRVGTAVTVAFPVLPVPFNTVITDTLGLWNAAGNHFLIPSGVSKVRLGARIQGPADSATGSLLVGVYKVDAANASLGEVDNYTTTVRNAAASGFNDNVSFCHTRIIDVVAGDRFAVRVNRSGLGSTLQITPVSFFEIEVLA